MTITRSLARGIAGLVLILLPGTTFAQQRAPTPPPIRALGLPLAIAANTSAVDQREITPPPEFLSRGMSNSVTLRAGASSAVIQSLRVSRQLPLSQLRSEPVLKLGNVRVNMGPVLSNPRALFNVAQRVRLQPQLAEVIFDDTQVYEVDQGLIVRSFMTYRIKPGVCNDPQKRAKLGTSGVSCATKLSGQVRAAAFGNPTDVRYVADPAKRAQAVAEAQSKSVLVDADLNANVAQLRASLSDPTARALIDTERGAGESSRLAALSDEQLKEELVTTSATSIEQTAFIPRADKLDAMRAQPVSTGGAPAPEQGKPDQDVVTQLTPRIFLTGFTLGRNYEWKERVQKKIGWCAVYCKTYYAEAYVSFSYAFGLRFPIRLEGNYQYHKAGTVETATVTPTFTPFNGNEADYASTGLPGDKILEGKEIVAQVSASGGAGYNLPGLPASSVAATVPVDFTQYLSGDFTNGQFAPPAPGAAENPNMVKTIDEIDLLGGLANFGVFGAQVFPAIKLELDSESLTFSLYDKLLSSDTRISSGQKVDLAVRPSDHSSQFVISDPVYELSFLVTPGIDARVFLDLAVWSDHWDWFLWFPQLQIELPPGGAKFGCHAATVCSRHYSYTPTSQTDTAGGESGFPADMEKWGLGFDGKWLSECPDETCRFGIRFVRQGVIYSALHKFDVDDKIKIGGLGALFAQADKDAQTLVDEGQARQTAKASKSYSTLMLAVWSGRCSDSLCFKNIKGIIFFAEWEMNAMQAQNPDMSTNQVLGEAGKKFVPSLQAEVDASKARVAAEEAWRNKLLGKPVLIYNLPSQPTFPPATIGKVPSGIRSATPPPMTPSRSEMPSLAPPVRSQNRLPPTVRPPVTPMSTLCRFTSGPRAGQVQDYAPMAPIAVGSSCQDAKGSYGAVVAN